MLTLKLFSVEAELLSTNACAFFNLFHVQGVPGAVKIEDLPSKTKKVSVKIKWIEPQNNGAPITQYTVYQRIVGNVTVEEWNKVRVIMDPSRRQVIVELDRNKFYEFVVTATNKHGESVQKEKNIRKVVVLGGK